MQIQHILAPTDFSEVSKEAVDYAFALAHKFGAKLSLLHVIELPTYPLEGHLPSDLAISLLDDLERHAKLDLAHLLPEAEAAQGEVERHVVIGTPYHKIVAVAATEKVDLIVMTTHGRTGLSHLVMGSVAERVVRTSPCPVLTLRGSWSIIR
ncbi:MAG: universal stress protein [Nitrospinae bacterium]|nr:universal stress protein [Nitrospinota bacterium]